MAIAIYQLPTSSSPAQICILPPNSQVILSVPSASTTVFVGLSNNVTSTSGYAINPGVPHPFTIPPPSQAGTLYALSSVASIISVIIVTTE